MLKRTIIGFGSLLSGMGVTLRHMFRKPVTAEYPHVEPELTEAYRSAIELIRFDEMGTHDCVACMQCEEICPSFCISIEGEKVEGVKRKRATKFEMDFALCSLCGLCIDVCPTVTLKYSRLYDEAGYTRDWTFDLLEGFQDGEAAYIVRARAEEVERQAEKAAKKKAAAEAKAQASAEAEAAAPAETEAAPVEAAAAEAAPAETAPVEAATAPAKAEVETAPAPGQSEGDEG